MIALSVDTTSSDDAAGRITGIFMAATIALTCIRVLSEPWRNAVGHTSLSPTVRAALRAECHRVVIGATFVIVLFVGVRAAAVV
ncbi:hypothetical protein [Streptomyces sp. NRRL S-237]|uniref:hypothetical protein n=1 Tax=Streptomyces sp. NRRL S-237 TaxID=1463895 RepID=UPI0004C79090|nr:hypothetical protein [Streptomyces sp. NRRL S-237]